MKAPLLLTLLIGYIAFASVFLVIAWKSPPLAKWGGLSAIAAAAPFFIWLGAFGEQFGAGQCYSNTFSMIGNAVARTDAPVMLAKEIRALPFRGYETSCAEVEAAAKKLPNASAP